MTEELLTNSGQYFGPGHLKLKDLNGDGHLDADNDRQVIGHALPNILEVLVFQQDGRDLTSLLYLTGLMEMMCSMLIK